MNKGVIFNVVISIAVVVLFFMEFQNTTRSTVNEQSVEEIANNLPEGRVEYPLSGTSLEGLRIAYVNIDSVNLNYVMLIEMEEDFKKQAESGQIHVPTFYQY